jgi:hypothetical protein
MNIYFKPMNIISLINLRLFLFYINGLSSSVKWQNNKIIFTAVINKFYVSVAEIW